jgi:hypothetical protein
VIPVSKNMADMWMLCLINTVHDTVDCYWPNLKITKYPIIPFYELYTQTKPKPNEFHEFYPDLIYALLEDGWEPFAIGNSDTQGDYLGFRKKTNA